MLPVIWPDGHMVVDVVGKMVWQSPHLRNASAIVLSLESINRTISESAENGRSKANKR